MHRKRYCAAQCIAESCGNSGISIVLPVIRKGMEDFNKLNFEREWGPVNKGHYAMIDESPK